MGLSHWITTTTVNHSHGWDPKQASKFDGGADFADFPPPTAVIHTPLSSAQMPPLIF